MDTNLEQNKWKRRTRKEEKGIRGIMQRKRREIALRRIPMRKKKCDERKIKEHEKQKDRWY